jgi:glutathione S-transferase
MSDVRCRTPEGTHRDSSDLRHLTSDIPQVASWGEANKPRVTAFLPILERQLEGGPFVCGARYSVADITALVAIDFMKPAKLAVPPEHTNIAKWHAVVSARPSAGA